MTCDIIIGDSYHNVTNENVLMTLWKYLHPDETFFESFHIFHPSDNHHCYAVSQNNLMDYPWNENPYKTKLFLSTESYQFCSCWRNLQSTQSYDPLCLIVCRSQIFNICIKWEKLPRCTLSVHFELVDIVNYSLLCTHPCSCLQLMLVWDEFSFFNYRYHNKGTVWKHELNN